ncbi:MAG: hypothetical protein ACRD43_14710, partial [Pyrinomonadaceae bacterium]
MEGARPVEALEKLKKEVARGSRVVSLNGLTSIAAKAFVLSKLQSGTAKTFVLVTGTNKDLDLFQNDLLFFRSQIEVQSSQILSLPSFETDTYS